MDVSLKLLTSLLEDANLSEKNKFVCFGEGGMLNATQERNSLQNRKNTCQNYIASYFCNKEIIHKNQFLSKAKQRVYTQVLKYFSQRKSFLSISLGLFLVYLTTPSTVQTLQRRMKGWLMS
jgi:hypothetical protein